MKDCDVGICPGKDSCVLKPYFEKRHTKTLLQRAELAQTVETFVNCAILEDLSKRYSRRLAASRKASQQLRSQKS